MLYNSVWEQAIYRVKNVQLYQAYVLHYPEVIASDFVKTPAFVKNLDPDQWPVTSDQ